MYKRGIHPVRLIKNVGYMMPWTVSIYTSYSICSTYVY